METPVERELVAKDGRIVNVLLKTTPETGETNDGHGVLAMYLDISARKRDQERLARSLAEQETLLRELYHRTKNNMATINALLSLQADFSGNPEVGEALMCTQDRIRAMALVHQRLYDAQDLSRIELHGYLHDLCAQLGSGQPGRVRVAEAAPGEEEAYVLIDTALPCGLALNELISNALRHGFPDGREGTVTVGLSRPGDGELELSVRDDGVGLPAGFDPGKDGGLGMLIITGLVEGQLGGSFRFGPGPGTECLIRFRDGRDSATGGEPATRVP